MSRRERKESFEKEGKPVREKKTIFIENTNASGSISSPTSDKMNVGRSKAKTVGALAPTALPR